MYGSQKIEKFEISKKKAFRAFAMLVIPSETFNSSVLSCVYFNKYLYI